MTSSTAFIQSLLDTPDDTTRLIFADWLEEQDDPVLAARGGFLRTEVQLANWVPAVERREALYQQQRQWINQYQNVWLGPLRALCQSWRFERGLTTITLEARRLLGRKFAAHGKELLDNAWVQRVRLVDVTASLLASLSEAPVLALLRQLDLDGANLDDANGRLLARSPYLANLTHLDLANNQLSDRSLLALVESPHLGKLTWLDLRNNRITSRGLWALLTSPLSNRLGWLDLHGNPLDPNAIQALATWQQQRLAHIPCPVGDRPRRVNSLGMQFIEIPAGSFLMGSPDSEPGRYPDEGPTHVVKLTQPYYLGVCAVTQGEFQRVMGRNPAEYNHDNLGGPNHPVEHVSWKEAVTFCERLTELPDEKNQGRRYRLPTEAEWEHACRAGLPSSVPSQFGLSFTSTEANFDGNSPYGAAPRSRNLGRTTAVGSYQPNAWGLYDMHGNVWNWCADWYASDYYQHSSAIDPTGPKGGTTRSLRGGSWAGPGRNCRCACRGSGDPEAHSPYFGLRLVMIPPE